MTALDVERGGAREAVLAALVASGDAFVPRDELRARAGVPPVDLPGVLADLATCGIAIETRPGAGHRLARRRPRLDVARVASAAASAAPRWRDVRAFAVVGSTNDVALALAAGSGPGATPVRDAVIVAEAQTRGRGRAARVWFSPPGAGLWASFLIRPRFAPPLARFVTIAAAVAAVRAIRDVAALDVALKWPNDLVARRDTSAGVPGAPAWLKLGGILAESRVRGDAIEAVVVGVGLNIDLAPDELPAGVALIATSLGALTGRSVSREDLLVALLARFAETLDALERGATAALVAAFRERTILLGESVTIDGGEGALTGVVRGIDDAGALLVERGDGTIVAVVAGEASLRPRGDAEAGTDAH